MVKSTSLSIIFCLFLSSAAFADEPSDGSGVSLDEGRGSDLPSSLGTQGAPGDQKHVSPKTLWSLVTPPVQGKDETDLTKETIGRRNMMRDGSSEGQPVLKQARGGHLMQAGLGLLTAPGYNLNNLPPTVLMGFVDQSGKNEAIYGDEGIYLPPYFGFEEQHRIARGNLPGMLGTGHGSLLEEGCDGGIPRPRTSMSGPTYSNPEF